MMTLKNLPTCSEYVDNINIPSLVLDPNLHGFKPEFKGDNIIRYTGGFCIVFPFEGNSKKYAVRLWHSSVSNMQKRTELISLYIKKVKLPYFVDFDYVEQGFKTSQGIVPLVRMEWVCADTLKEFLQKNLNNKLVLERLAANFLEMINKLHESNISHGDLQHGNILVKPDVSLILVDYDSMFVPGMESYTDEIKGLLGYQHPCRWQQKFASPKSDYFSESIIYLSILALAESPNLWNDLKMEDTDFLLFSNNDILSKGNSNIFNTLKKSPKLKELSAKISSMLSFTFIDQITPLEHVIKNQSESIINKMTEAIKSIPQAKEVRNEDISVLAKRIGSKFPDSTPPNITHHITKSTNNKI